MREWGRIRWREDGGKRRPFLDFRPHGRIYSTREGRKLETEAQAQELLNEIRAAFVGGRLSKAATIADYGRRIAPEMRLSAKYRRWLAHMDARVAAGDVTPEYVRELRRYGTKPGYLEPLAERVPAAVTAGDLRDLSLWLAQQGRSPKTRSHVLNALRMFFHWLAEGEEIERVPRFPSVTVPEHEPRILAPEEQRAVLDAIPGERRGIFLALAFHGLRPSEAARLDVADYDWRAGVAWLPGRKAKSRKKAGVPFGAELRAWLEQHSDRQRVGAVPLFVNAKGRQPGLRWSVDALEKTWEAACKRVGVRAGLYEGTKHTSATNALRRGVALDQIQAALRHADIRSTQKYARAADLAPVEVFDGKGRESDRKRDRLH